MNTYKSSAQLKIIAKSQLFGKLGTVIGAFLVHILLYIPIIYLIEYIGIGTTYGLILYFGATILVDLYAGILSTGEKYIYLKLASGAEISVSDVFYGFHNNPKKIMLIRFIPVVATVLFRVPGFILLEKFSRVAPDVDSMMMMLQTGEIEEFVQLSYDLFPITSMIMVFKVLEILVALAADVIFSQTLYFMLDYPDYSVSDTLRHSIRILKGNWGRYLYIKLSFIPWYMLGIVTLYAGFLWTFPYYNATCANLYIDIIKNHEQSKK